MSNLTYIAIHPLEVCGHCGTDLLALADGGHDLNEVAGENIADGTEWRCCECYAELTGETCAATCQECGEAHDTDGAHLDEVWCDSCEHWHTGRPHNRE